MPDLDFLSLLAEMQQCAARPTVERRRSDGCKQLGHLAILSSPPSPAVGPRAVRHSSLIFRSHHGARVRQLSPDDPHRIVKLEDLPAAQLKDEIQVRRLDSGAGSFSRLDRPTHSSAPP